MNAVVAARGVSPERQATIARLAQEQGTPLLVLDPQRISARFDDLTHSLPGYQVHYAVKANDDTRILELLRDRGAGFDVSSAGELRLLLSLGVAASRIVSSNPIKSPRFVAESWRAGVRSFAFDSFEEIDKLASLAPASRAYVRLSVPNEGSEWPLTRKFGMRPEDALDCLAYAKSRDLRACGMAFHVGSQNVEPQAWVTALEMAHDVWEQAEARGIAMSLLNIGGGFPITYCRDIAPLSEFAGVIAGTVDRLFPRGIELVTEPGRFLVGEAGVLASTVVAKARRDGKRWVYLDVGVFNGLMEGLGGIRYQLVTTREGPREQVVLAGPSCDSFDVICTEVELPDVEVGDLVLFLSAGAYTTVYGSRFNGFEPPSVHFVG